MEYPRAWNRIQGKIDRAIQYMCSWGLNKARDKPVVPVGMQASFLEAPIIRKGDYLRPSGLKTVHVR